MSGKQNEIIRALEKTKINEDICLVDACREFKYVRAHTQRMYVWRVWIVSLRILQKKIKLQRGWAIIPFVSIGLEALVPQWLSSSFHGIITNLFTESEVTSLCIKWIHWHVHNAGNTEDSWKQESNVSIELDLYLVIQNVFPTRKQ